MVVDGAVIGRYKRLFRSSSEAAIFAVYGLVHLFVMLMADEAEQVKALLHVLGVK